ncbi:MAG: 5-(carboxyamino)imidazole ribonucleotide synthase [Xanthobacteraceae bacterium]|nr:MAG: 5-(carboxyamino)imidazole ribonucleotide synthase [Xanthobacteraceae bacterium]
MTASIAIMLAPGSTIGILGGGQLGRMLALAAARLGFKCHIYAPEPDSPAFDVVRFATCADYTDAVALENFADEVDVVTYEFENVPAETASLLSAHAPVLPDPKVLEITQDRLAEKNFITRLGIATAAYADVTSEADLAAALSRIGLPAVLKTRRFGYDGKGQAMLREASAAAAAFRELGGNPCILEAFVPFEREVSVIAARNADGQIECFDVTENEHRDHILKVSRAPAEIPESLASEARAIARAIAEAFGYVGVMAVEMFVVPAPGGPTLAVNEIAPRVHNSGHWTLDGCAVSQFEQHVRAIAGWPLAPARRHGRATMTNLIGDEVESHGQWLARPGATVHLYGKTAARPGRKMGHVTVIEPEKP